MPPISALGSDKVLLPMEPPKVGLLTRVKHLVGVGT